MEEGFSLDCHAGRVNGASPLVVQRRLKDVEKPPSFVAYAGEMFCVGFDVILPLTSR